MPLYPNDQGNPLGAIPVYSAPPPGQTFTNLTSAGTSELKSLPGYVTGISVNTPVASTTLKLYDGDPSGTGILLGTWSTAASVSWSLSLPFATSLWAVTSGTADVTVSYV